MVEMFSSLYFQGGPRSFNIVRGPGFHGTGRGGDKVFQSFDDFNLCGPSLHALKQSEPGYTTHSGLLQPLIKSFYKMALQKNSSAGALFVSPIVHVIPACLATDATAIKPGLEYDSCQKEIIGATVDIDINYVQGNPVPDINDLKAKLVTEANVSFLTALDNGVSLPVAVDYPPKSTKGEQVKATLSDYVIGTQTCADCLQHCGSENNILDVNSAKLVCTSFCASCWDLQGICDECAQHGQISHFPALRACDQCIAKGSKCSRVAVFAISADCEDKNKKAMSLFEQGLEPELSLVQFIPDAVHVGKSLKCSWANWFLIFEGQRSNLVLLRTLRDSADQPIKEQLKKLLDMESVRNKDRMAVEPILKISQPKVIEILDHIPYVCSTIVPETYKYWKNNSVGQIKMPISICCGRAGNLVVLENHDGKGQLYEIQLHYPANVTLLKKGFIAPKCCTYVNGVVYIAEPEKIKFLDLQCKVKLNPAKLKSKKSLVDELAKRNLEHTGTIASMRMRLKNHLKSREDQVVDPNSIDLNVAIHPSVICAQDDRLFCCDDDERCIWEIELSFDGVSVNGKVIRYVSYLEEVCATSVCCSAQQLFVSLVGKDISGIYKCERSTMTAVRLQDGITAISLNEERNTLVFGAGHHIVSCNLENNNVTTVAGLDGVAGYKDGTNTSCRFSRPSSICIEGDTIFISDIARVAIIVPLSGTVQFLNVLGKIYKAFGVHLKKDQVDTSILGAVRDMQNVNLFLDLHAVSAQITQGLPALKTMNGPEGTVSNKTRLSCVMLESRLRNLEENLQIGDYQMDVSTLLTTVVENLHAVSHFKHDTFSMLDYARDFGTVMKESIKRSCSSSFKYFTSSHSYYPVPDTNMNLDTLKSLCLHKPHGNISSAEEKHMRLWVEPFRPLRQRTVRRETTMDKAGTLPIILYANAEKAQNLARNLQGLEEVNHVMPEDNHEVPEDNHEVPEDNHEATDTDDPTSEYDSDESVNEQDSIVPNEDDDRIVLRSRSGRVIKAICKLNL